MPPSAILFTEAQRRDIVARYPEESMRTIGRDHYVGIGPIRRVLREAGVELRKPGGPKQKLPREEIEQMDWLYHGLGWNLADVAAEFGTTPEAMRARFERNGIPVRSRADVNRKQWEGVPSEERSARGRRAWSAVSPENQQAARERLAHYSRSRAASPDPA